MRKHIKDDLLTSLKPSKECAGSGYVPAWSVGRNYRIINGLLCEGKSEDWKFYNPFSELKLPTAIGRIATGELSPIAFASEFGLLGYENLKMPAESPPGEPIEWIVAHSRTVRFCLDWIGMLQEGDQFEIEHALEALAPGPYAWGLGFGTLRWGKRSVDGNRSAEAVRKRVANFITENIRGITRRMETDPFGTRARSFFTFRGMIEAIYWQLADQMERGGIRRCNACRGFFIARDKRQDYCPPFPGSTRSRCSSRLNTRNWRDRSQ